MASNKKLGSDFEGRFAQELFKMGFWVHLLTQNSAGQPADLIASKDGKAALIDCKVCEKGHFRLDRVEDNQIQAMSLWEECKNGPGWFALELPIGQVRMFSLQQLKDLSCLHTIIPREKILQGMTVEEWVKAWN